MGGTVPTALPVADGWDAGARFVNIGGKSKSDWREGERGRGRGTERGREGERESTCVSEQL